MINLDQNHLLFIEPKNPRSAKPNTDELSAKMARLLRNAKPGPAYRGFHRCICGEISTSCDYIIGNIVTNSLATHYLMYHRDEIPRTELAKLLCIDE